MVSIDYAMIIDRLMRYYFPVLFLIPMLIIFINMDKRVTRASSKSIYLMVVVLLIMILADVFEYWLSTLDHPCWERVFFSVIGYCLRPACMLIILLDTIPGSASSKKRTLLLSLPSMINTAVYITAFFSPIAFSFDEYNRFLRGPLNHAVVISSALYLILLTAVMVSNLHHRQRRKFITILFICASCYCAAILEMIGVAYPAPLLNQAISVSTIMYFLVQYVTVSSETIENMTLSLLLMQIRPHFINNSLAAIRGMLRRDPEKAAEALSHFSGYLQNTMNSVLKTDLIPFSQEMDLIDNYLYMENVRFRDSFTVTKELIPVDFPVPPLTVQPLVENAVRHGLRGIQTHGQLTIRTEMDPKEYRITIIDNGIGFDPSVPPDNDRPHVGLKNVRSRLDILCNGTLEIQSGSSGTTAVIRIPARVINNISFDINHRP